MRKPKLQNSIPSLLSWMWRCLIQPLLQCSQFGHEFQNDFLINAYELFLTCFAFEKRLSKQTASRRERKEGIGGGGGGFGCHSEEKSRIK